MSNVLRTFWLGNRQSLRNVVTQRRYISRTISRNEKPSLSVASETTPPLNSKTTMGITHTVKPYQKYILVWTGKYKSIAEIPEKVSHGVLDSALNKARIKIAIWMMIGTVLMAIGAVYSGKKAVARGESLAKTGLEYQRMLKEQGMKEREAAAAAAAAAETK